MKPATHKPQLTSDVLEYAQSNTTYKVDRERGIIFNVKIAGLRSRNGYDYGENVYRDAISLYENVGVNVDHTKTPGQNRSARDCIGWLQDCKIEGKEPFGNLHLIDPTEPFSVKLMNAAEKRPTLFGLSHEARVKWRTPARTVAESILAVKSVDVVLGAATVSSLFEQYQENPVVTTTIKEARAQVPVSSVATKKFFDWLCEDDMGMGDAPLDMPSPPESVGSADEQLVAGFKAAVMAVIEDTSLDLAGKKSKIGELLKMLDKVQNGGDAAPAEEMPAEDAAAAEESAKPKPAPTDSPTIATLREENKSLRRENLLHRVCAAEKYEPTPVMLKHLSRCESEADMKELIQEARKATSQEPARSGSQETPKPKVKSGLQTTVSESTKVPATQEEFNKVCFN